jgi:minor extracellular serine protease Vpr
MSRSRLLALVVLALVSTASAPVAANRMELPDGGTGLVARLVMLDVPTRWDVWVAAGGQADTASTGRAPRQVDARADRAADAAGAGVARAAVPVVTAVERAGGRVLAVYDTALAGVLVHVPAHTESALAALPGVRAVRPAPWAKLALMKPASASGASRTQAENTDGHGATIAVADTGIDYTHAAFGGPGTEAAYQAAKANAERIDDTWAGQTLFPNARVRAGWDFAGPRYSPDCSPAGAQSGHCSVDPEPDPDPLDVNGHGTHVASIAGGLATGPVAAGVAPGADLVALKIFGATGVTELIADPIEWVIEANMGAPGRPHIDVLNLSLGQIYGGEVLSESGAIARAVAAGVVVVASAGNDGDIPFVASAPAIAPDALAVASIVPPGQHGYQATLVAGTDAPVTFGESSVFMQGWSPDPHRTFSAPLVFVGRGCPESPDQPEDRYLADPKGAIGVFQLSWGDAGPSCTADRQARRLEDAGAVGALMATAIGVQTAGAWDAAPVVDMPVWMVATDVESAVTAAAKAGKAMTVTLAPVPHPEQTGLISSFSSRGPARTADPKPDLSASGTGIVAAAVGEGYRGIAHSGTSMAAPQVSGSAALVWSAARAAGSTLNARDVAALLVNTADPAAPRQVEGASNPPPVARMGAGAVDAASASQADSVLRAGTLASLGFGVQVLSGPPVTLTRTVSVRNLAAAPRHYALHFEARPPRQVDAGLTLTASPDRLDVPGGGVAQVTVTARFDPAGFPSWSMAGGENAGNGSALAGSELDGWLTALESAAGDVTTHTLRVPYYALVRPASDVTAGWDGPPGGPWTVRLANHGVADGLVALYSAATVDGVDPDIPAKVDLDLVGVRAVPQPHDGTTRIEFLLHTRGARMAPLETASVIDLDIDKDGRADYELYTADEGLSKTQSIRNGNVMAVLEPPSGSPFGSPVMRFYAGVDIQSRYTVLPFRLEDTGLTPSTMTFNYRVRQQDRVEQDITRTPLFDQVPPGDSWLTFDGRAPALVASRTVLVVAPGGQDQITVAAGAGFAVQPDARLVALFPNNAPGAGDAVLLPPDAPPTYPLYLPGLWR